MTVLNNAVRTASRVGSRRTMSESAGPRMHKAKDAWKEIQATRPPEGHPHVSTNELKYKKQTPARRSSIADCQWGFLPVCRSYW